MDGGGLITQSIEMWFQGTWNATTTCTKKLKLDYNMVSFWILFNLQRNHEEEEGGKQWSSKFMEKLRGDEVVRPGGERERERGGKESKARHWKGWHILPTPPTDVISHPCSFLDKVMMCQLYVQCSENNLDSWFLCV